MQDEDDGIIVVTAYHDDYFAIIFNSRAELTAEHWCAAPRWTTLAKALELKSNFLSRRFIFFIAETAETHSVIAGTVEL